MRSHTRPTDFLCLLVVCLCTCIVDSVAAACRVRHRTWYAATDCTLASIDVQHSVSSPSLSVSLPPPPLPLSQARLLDASLLCVLCVLQDILEIGRGDFEPINQHQLNMARTHMTLWCISKAVLLL